MNNDIFFVICTTKELHPDFQFRKVYKAQHDELENQTGFIRVFNEFEEDFLYPQSSFHQVPLSKETQDVLLKASRRIA